MTVIARSEATKHRVYRGAANPEYFVWDNKLTYI